MPFRLWTFAPLFVALALVSTTSAVMGRPADSRACPPDQEAAVRGLFGALMDRLGPTTGTPVGCLSDTADGGLSLTTTGLLYARPEQGGPVRIVVFTDGHRHWGMDAALSQVTLYWEGESPYPPAQGVTRQPATGPNGQPPAHWPVAPAPTVGRAPAPPAPIYRPESGENLIPPTYGGGRGSLKIKNDFPQDLALKLRDAPPPDGVEQRPGRRRVAPASRHPRAIRRTALTAPDHHAGTYQRADRSSLPG